MNRKGIPTQPELALDPAVAAAKEMKLRVIRLVVVAVTVIFFLFVFVNTSRGDVLLAILDVIVVLLLWSALWSFRWHRNVELLSVTVLMIPAGFLLFLVTRIGPQAYYWAYVLPPLLHYLVGHRRGSIVGIPFTVALLALLFLESPAAMSGFHKIVFASSFTLTGVASFLTERVREQFEGRLVYLAERDDLTGLFNRRRLPDFFALEMQRKKRYGHPFSLLTFDIDRFKKINDTHGHSAGDEVLKSLSALALAHIRSMDRLVRVGGEEFVIVAPHTNLEHAVVLAQKLRTLVAEHVFERPQRITISVGVGEVNMGEELPTALERVDRALYRAKVGGRNRVEPDSASG